MEESKNIITEELNASQVEVLAELEEAEAIIEESKNSKSKSTENGNKIMGPVFRIGKGKVSTTSQTNSRQSNTSTQQRKASL